VNVHQCRIALRPRGPLEVFDLALRLLRAHPAVFLRLGAILVLPVAAVFAVGAVATGGHWGWLVAVFAISPALQAPFTVLAGRLLFADEYSVRQVRQELWGSLGALVATLGWSWALMVLGAACGLVGLVVTVPLSTFLAEAALLERTKDSVLARSSKLAMYSPIGALAVAAAWLGLTAWGAVVADGAGQLLVGWLLELGSWDVGSLLDGVVTPYAVAGALAVQPFVGLYRLLMFVDVRTRVDGWDLQVGLRAVRLAAEGKAPPA